MRFFLYVRVDVGLLRYRMGWEFSCDFFFFGFFGSPTAFAVTDVNIVSYL